MRDNIRRADLALDDVALAFEHALDGRVEVGFFDGGGHVLRSAPAMLYRMSLGKYGARRPSLPVGISPARGEIDVSPLSPFLAPLKKRESGGRERSPPSRGRCPTGQRGAPRAELSIIRPSARSNSREIICRCISLVPSQIRSTLASRQMRSSGRSSIRPMPPWIWIASSATKASISVAFSLAIAMSASVTVPCSNFHPASSVNSSAAFSSIAMSASLKETPWNLPIFWPNCSRSAA